MNWSLLSLNRWDRSDLDITFELYKLVIPKRDVSIELKEDENTESIWELPKDLYKRDDLMIGLYSILEDNYKV